MGVRKVLDQMGIISFEWDEGNIHKSKHRHGVTIQESEAIFIYKPLLIHIDFYHLTEEIRFQALGKTIKGRKLFVIFTVRKNKIRIISARDQNKKERRYYEKAEKNTTI